MNIWEIIATQGKQYLKDAMPGGLLNRELDYESLRKAGEVASMTPTPLGDAMSGLLAMDDVRQGNYGSAALNGVGLLPFVPSIGGMVKKIPLTESEFFKKYAMHKDIRGKMAGTLEENAKSIMESGFKKGSNVNALPPYRGGKPSNVIDAGFAPKKGDYVYLAPKNAWRDAPNGIEIQNGWIPEPYELIKIESDFPNMYEEYLKAFNKNVK